MADSAPQLRRCTFITQDDIRALAEFLRSPNKTEGQLQRLFEKHTGIIGALGYSEFFPEYPVYKRDESEVLLDGRRRDRIDIVAVKESAILDQATTPYKSPHVIELKRAHEKILDRPDGMRLSDAAKNGLEQLKNYAEWLTTVQENRDALGRFGLNVLRPGKHLVMGTQVVAELYTATSSCVTGCQKDWRISLESGYNRLPGDLIFHSRKPWLISVITGHSGRPSRMALSLPCRTKQ